MGAPGPVSGSARVVDAKGSAFGSRLTGKAWAHSLFGMAALALAGFKAAPPSKSPVGPIAFEDFEALEAGQSHEFVSPALLTPSPVPTPRRPKRATRRFSGAALA